MRSLLVLVVLVAVATAVSVTKAPLYGDPEKSIKDQYMVVFQKDLTDEQIKRHHDAVAGLKATSAVEVRHTLKFIKAYFATMSPDAVEMVRLMPEVRYIERNGIVHIAQNCQEQPEVTWGLARVSKEAPYQAGDPYVYDDAANGQDIDVYIIDTGIQTTHPDFTGRAKYGADCYISLNCPNTDSGDPNGHGTHVASTATGTTYGIAKKATAIAVRVLSAGGSGSYEQVVAGVEWVTAQRRSNSRKSVANMSLGGASSTLLDEAVNEAVEAGVHMIVAAGNEFQNACNRSPAGANGVTAVGATDDIDSMAYFSNYGECVEIFAPGVNVLAAYPTDSTATLSGTSMAAPHVAGVVADVLSKCPDVPPPVMETFLKANANKDKVNGLPPGHEDHDDLVYKTCNLGCPSA